MIVTFSVANFRSFSSEETISFVASKRLTGLHENHLVPIPGSEEKVLRTAVLYGANGAGKSNLFKALRYVKHIALESRPKTLGTGRKPFFNTIDQPSSFDLQFIADSKLFRFGFKADDHRIIEEWLVQIEGENERVIYERLTDDNGTVTINAEGLKAAPKPYALAMLGGPKNQSFLSTVRATLETPDVGDLVGSVLNWFNSDLRLIGPLDSFEKLGHSLEQDSDLLAFADDFLKFASTGVDHLDIEKKELSDDSFGPSWFSLAESLSGSNEEIAVLPVEIGTEYGISRTKTGRHYRLTVQAVHQITPNENASLNLHEESDGTKRLLDLIPALHYTRTNAATYFIDEIDRSLHPILVKEFLDLFVKSGDRGQSQLIVTTHESNLLDLELVRRDEIWFAEKDQQSATRLYSLIDFPIRDGEIRKHYLQGRFGAIPFLGNLDKLRGAPAHTG